MRIAQYNRTILPYDGIAESALTSNVVFLGDASMAVWSLASSSATASRWTIQGSLTDGFTAAIEASSWFDVKGVTAPGLNSVDTITRWVRFQRAPSNSSSTIRLTYYVGP